MCAPQQGVLARLRRDYTLAEQIKRAYPLPTFGTAAQLHDHFDGFKCLQAANNAGDDLRRSGQTQTEDARTEARGGLEAASCGEQTTYAEDAAIRAVGDGRRRGRHGKEAAVAGSA